MFYFHTFREYDTALIFKKNFLILAQAVSHINMNNKSFFMNILTLNGSLLLLLQHIQMVKRANPG